MKKINDDALVIECIDCGDFAVDVDNVGATEFKAQARDAGWTFPRDGGALCDECRPTPHRRSTSPVATFWV